MKPRENFMRLVEDENGCMTSCYFSGLYFNMVWVDDEDEGICVWCFYDEGGKCIGFGEYRAF